MRVLLLLIISYLYVLADGHIFVYHRFGDSRYPSANITNAQLRANFQYLKDKGYKAVPLSAFEDRLSKHLDIPDNWVAFTIDDGYKSFYENGFKIFKEFNYPFTVYVYVEATYRRYGDFVTWKQLKELDKYGSIGIHSFAHPRLINLSLDEVKKDTQKAVKIFTKHMGYAPKSYAYPYGEYNDKIKEVIKSFGFRSIMNQNIGSVNKNSDIFDINRLAMVGKSNIVQKLKYKTIAIKWIEPKEFPKDGILRRIKAKTDIKTDKLKLYITKEGWRDVKVVNGIVDKKLNIYLKNSRTRLILGTTVYNISNNIIIKHKGVKNVK